MVANWTTFQCGPIKFIFKKIVKIKIFSTIQFLIRFRTLQTLKNDSCHLPLKLSPIFSFLKYFFVSFNKKKFHTWKHMTTKNKINSANTVYDNRTKEYVWRVYEYKFYYIFTFLCVSLAWFKVKEFALISIFRKCLSSLKKVGWGLLNLFFWENLFNWIFLRDFSWISLRDLLVEKEIEVYP